MMTSEKPAATRLLGEDGAPIYELKAEFFRMLGHPARVRILELLRGGERSVSYLQEALELDSSGTSQHLTAMRRQGLLVSRRDGKSVLYSVKDPRIFQVLASAREVLTTHLEETSALLAQFGDA
jgi:DNA-binding transcriptional ArsR family regulator